MSRRLSVNAAGRGSPTAGGRTKSRSSSIGDARLGTPITQGRTLRTPTADRPPTRCSSVLSKTSSVNPPHSRSEGRPEDKPQHVERRVASSARDGAKRAPDTLPAAAEPREELRRTTSEVARGQPAEEAVVDREAKFSALLGEYASLYKTAVGAEDARPPARWPRRTSAPWTPPLEAPPTDLEEAQERFREWRAAVSSHVADLDERLPKLRLRAEAIREEVYTAGATSCGAESMKDFVVQFLSRRLETIQSHRAMLKARARRSGGSVAGQATLRGSDAVASSLMLHAAYEGSLRNVDRELEMCSQRLGKIQGTDDFITLVATSAWTGSVLVAVRQLLFEDVATRQLRRFLSQLSFANLTHRDRLWRKSLELHASLHLAKESASALPLRLTSRKKLEAVLEELGPAFGCGASIQTDRGKVFLHQVAISFPGTFGQQQRRWAFASYPIDTAGSSTQAAPVVNVPSANVGTSSFRATLRKSVSNIGGGGASMLGSVPTTPKLPPAVAPGGASTTTQADDDEERKYYIRQGSWIDRMPWRARSEPSIEEQGLLLRASYASATNPDRTQCRESTYACDLLRDALSEVDAPHSKGVGGHAGADVTGWARDVDSLLRAEWSFLQVADAQAVLRPLGDASAAGAGAQADRQSSAGANLPQGEVPEERSSIPTSLQRSFVLLRHLQSREQRWMLLGVLNVFRFMQRRLVAGVGVGSVGGKWSMTSRAKGSGDDRPQDRYWEVSLRTLLRVGRACPMPTLDGFAPQPDGVGGLRINGPMDEILAKEELVPDVGDAMSVMDSEKRHVIHALALDDLAVLEREMLSIGSFFIHKYEAGEMSEKGTRSESPIVDRAGVMLDLYTAEVWYNTEKRKLLEAYLEIAEHTADPLERSDVAQRMIDVMAERPRLDLEADYFTDAYTAAICALSSRASLLRRLVERQVLAERQAAEAAERSAAQHQTPMQRQMSGQKSERESTANSQFPRTREKDDSPERLGTAGTNATGSVGQAPGMVPTTSASPTCLADHMETAREKAERNEVVVPPLAHQHEGFMIGSLGLGARTGSIETKLTPAGTPISPAEFCASACMAWKAELILEEAHRDMVDHFHPKSPLMTTLLQRACFQIAHEILDKVVAEEKRRHHPRAVSNSPSVGRAASRPPTNSGQECFEQHEDADLLVAVARETAVRLTTTISSVHQQEVQRAATEREKMQDAKKAPESRRAASVGSRRASPMPPGPNYDDPTSLDPYGCPGPLKRVGSVDITGFLHMGFGELRRRVGANTPSVFSVMITHLLEHTHLRRRMADTVIEVIALEASLRAQAASFGVRLDSIRPAPRDASMFGFLSEVSAFARKVSAGGISSMNGGHLNPPAYSSQGAAAAPQSSEADVTGNRWLDPSCPVFSAGIIEASLGSFSFKTGRDMAMTCCAPNCVQELRVVLQHELAYRSFLLQCVHTNALLLDPEVRAAGINDVSMAGPSRDMVAADPAAWVIRRLRQTVELSSGGQAASWTDRRRSSADAAAADAPPREQIMDASRHSKGLQTPTFALEAASLAARMLFEERSEMLRAQVRQAEYDRAVRMLWQDLVSCNSMVLARCAMDLSVRIQATGAARELRSATAAIPLRLTPFGRATDRRPAMVGPDRQVGNVFSIPTAWETITVRSTVGGEDIGEVFGSLFAVFSPPPADRHEARRFSQMRSGLDAESDPGGGVALPAVEVDYGGPAFIQLALLHELGLLMALRTALVTVDGDAVTLLRLRRRVRYGLADLEASGADPIGELLSRTEPACEAFEELCAELGRVTRRLDALGEAARSPKRVLGVVAAEVRAAHRELALLLRRCARDFVAEGAVEVAAAFRQRSRALEAPWVGRAERGADGGDGSRCAVPIVVALPVFAEAVAAERRCAADEAWGRSAATCGGEGPQVQVRPWPANLPPGLVAAVSEEAAESMCGLPEITTLCQDRKRYAAAMHPETLPGHRLLHPFIEKLAGRHASLLPKHLPWPDVDGLDRNAPLPWHSRLLWAVPPAMLSLRLDVLLCQTSPQQRLHVSKLRAELAAMRQAFRSLNEVQEQSEEATDADAEAMGALVLVEHLKEFIICGKLSVPMPTTTPMLVDFEEHFEAVFAVSARGGDAGAPMSDDAQVRHQVETAYRLIRALVGEVDATLFSGVLGALGRDRAAAGELALQASVSAAKTANFKLPDPGIISDDPSSYCAELYASKVDVVLHALNPLRGCGAYVRMDPSGVDGEQAYVFKEEDLNTCIDELMFSLAQWGTRLARCRDRRVEESLRFLRSRRKALEFDLCLGGIEADEENSDDGGEQDFAIDPDGDAAHPQMPEAFASDDGAEVKNEAAGVGCAITFEVDRLHRIVREVRVVSRELEYRLTNEVWDKVRADAARLMSTLSVETGGLCEGHRHKAHDLAQQMRQLREHVFSELAKLAAKNHATQERAKTNRRDAIGLSQLDLDPMAPDGDGDGSEATASYMPSTARPRSAATSVGQRSVAQSRYDRQMLTVSDGMHDKLSAVARRDDVRVLLLQIEELEETQLLSRAFYVFKCDALLQRFEQKMQAIQMTLDSNNELSRRLAQMTQEQRAAAKAFAANAHNMSHAEQQIEDLCAQVGSNAEQRERLQTWRKNKAKQLHQIDHTVKDHARKGTVKVDELTTRIQDSGEIVQHLQIELCQEEEALERARKSAAAKTARVREQVLQQRRAKDATYEELKQLRSDVDRGGISEEERRQVWRSRITLARQRIQELEEENEELQRLVGCSSPGD